MPPTASSHHFRRALLVVDVEPRFITTNTRAVIPRIASLIHAGRYGVVVIAEYTSNPRKRAVSKSQWERAHGALHSHEETVPEIEAALADKRVMRVVKSTRSMFGPHEELAKALRRRGIHEVHIAGLETHDCVLATAFDSFDLGFKTFVLRHACASKRVASHLAACGILRNAKLLK